MRNSCSLGLRYVFLELVPNGQLSFFHLGFKIGNFFLIASFHDHCLLVPFLLETSLIVTAVGETLYRLHVVVLCSSYILMMSRVVLSNDQEMAQLERNSHSKNRSRAK